MTMGNRARRAGFIVALLGVLIDQMQKLWMLGPFDIGRRGGWR